MKVFGSRVYYLDTELGKGKLDQRSREGIFIGYSVESKGYRLWSPEKRKVIMNRDVKFLEKEGSSKEMTDNKTEASTSKENSNQTFGEIPHPVENFQKSKLELNDSETDSKPQNTESKPLRHRGRPRILRNGRRVRPRKLFNRGQNEKAELVETDEKEEQLFLSEVPYKTAIPTHMNGMKPSSTR